MAGDLQHVRDDLFALLTDGLTEVFDDSRQELGLDWAKQVLASNGQTTDSC